MIRLYYAPGACSLAVHIALEEAGAEFELERVDFRAGAQRSPAYLAVNPKGRVPTLQTDRGVLTECVAILAWIAQSWPEARLAPLEDAWAFAQMQSFNAFLASSVHPAWAHVSRPERYADGEAAAAAMRNKGPEALGGFYRIIEERFADGQPWANGEAYTVSDPYLAVITGWIMGRALLDFAQFPAAADHRRRTLERPAAQRALAREGRAQG
jgi:glutathione S-transferase